MDAREEALGPLVERGLDGGGPRREGLLAPEHRHVFELADGRRSASAPVVAPGDLSAREPAAEGGVVVAETTFARGPREDGRGNGGGSWRGPASQSAELGTQQQDNGCLQATVASTQREVMAWTGEIILTGCEDAESDERKSVETGPREGGRSSGGVILCALRRRERRMVVKNADRNDRGTASSS